jgi:hypothetical protein
MSQIFQFPLPLDIEMSAKRRPTLFTSQHIRFLPTKQGEREAIAVDDNNFTTKQDYASSPSGEGSCFGHRIVCLS